MCITFHRLEKWTLCNSSNFTLITVCITTRKLQNFIHIYETNPITVLPTWQARKITPRIERFQPLCGLRQLPPKWQNIFSDGKSYTSPVLYIAVYGIGCGDDDDDAFDNVVAAPVGSTRAGTVEKGQVLTLDFVAFLTRIVDSLVPLCRWIISGLLSLHSTLLCCNESVFFISEDRTFSKFNSQHIGRMKSNKKLGIQKCYI